MKIQRVKLRYLKISPRKARLVADLIRGLSVNEAEAHLLLLPHRASQPILKLLRSAAADAQNNQQIDPVKLFIKEIRVDQGPSLKRWRTRARGTSSLLKKPSCHISLILVESEKEMVSKFKFIPKAKKLKKEQKKEKPPKEMREKQRAEEEKKPKRFEALKRIFRRKAI